MPKWATKMLELATYCLIFVAAKSGVFKASTILFALSRYLKNSGIKALMKLTSGENSYDFSSTFRPSLNDHLFYVVLKCYFTSNFEH